MKVALILWAVWYVYWIVSARKRVQDTAESSVRREPFAGRLLYLALIVIGFGLLFLRRPIPYLEARLWTSTGAWQVSGLAVQVVGLGFAIWARSTLGKNWSGRITIGGSQQLVIQGPYRIVRHPIYSGLLLGALGTAVVAGLARAFLGVLLVLAGVLIKIRREETALRQHFGPDYGEYAARVPALVPGPRRSQGTQTRIGAE
jgi:protein-S-isoprenylcysteine O-methyltransferase Ste14